MACLLNLRTNLLSAADGGGTWTYLGYSSTVGGTYEVETPTPSFGPLTGDNPQIDTSEKSTGFYKFEYLGGTGICEDSVEVILQVIEGCHYTEVSDKSYCSGEAFTLDLVDIQSGCDSTVALGGTSDPLPPGVTLNTGTKQLIADAGATTISIGDDYIIDVTITRTSTPSAGYTEADCPNCDGGTYVVVVHIVESFDAGTPVSIAACS